MKLELGKTEAVLLGFGFGTLFVVSLYFWKAFEGKKPKGYVYQENSQGEIMKRITSVVIFSILSVCFINIKANHDERPEINIWRWFGMTISEKTDYIYFRSWQWQTPWSSTRFCSWANSPNCFLE